MVQLCIVVACVLIAVFIVRITPLQGRIERIIQVVMQPILSSSYSLKTAISTLIDPRSNDQQSIDGLKEEILRLQFENEHYKQFEIENEMLRTQLEFGRRFPRKPVSAHIIGTSDEFGSHVFVLDKGVHDGVTVGSAVIAQEGVLVGTISESHEFTSFLKLPNDDRSSIIVSIFKEKKELSGIAHGRFKIGVLVDKVQQSVKLAQGDTIVTSALNNQIPPGLLIGKVRDVLNTPNDLFQKATVTPALPYESLRIVGIVTK